MSGFTGRAVAESGEEAANPWKEWWSRASQWKVEIEPANGIIHHVWMELPEDPSSYRASSRQRQQAKENPAMNKACGPGNPGDGEEIEQSSAMEHKSADPNNPWQLSSLAMKCLASWEPQEQWLWVNCPASESQMKDIAMTIPHLTIMPLSCLRLVSIGQICGWLSNNVPVQIVKDILSMAILQEHGGLFADLDMFSTGRKVQPFEGHWYVLEPHPRAGAMYCRTSDRVTLAMFGMPRGSELSASLVSRWVARWTRFAETHRRNEMLRRGGNAKRSYKMAFPDKKGKEGNGKGCGDGKVTKGTKGKVTKGTEVQPAVDWNSGVDLRKHWMHNTNDMQAMVAAHPEFAKAIMQPVVAVPWSLLCKVRQIKDGPLDAMAPVTNMDYSKPYPEPSVATVARYSCACNLWARQWHDHEQTWVLDVLHRIRETNLAMSGRVKAARHEGNRGLRSSSGSRQSASMAGVMNGRTAAGQEATAAGGAAAAGAPMQPSLSMVADSLEALVGIGQTMGYINSHWIMARSHELLQSQAMVQARATLVALPDEWAAGIVLFTVRLHTHFGGLTAAASDVQGLERQLGSRLARASQISQLLGQGLPVA